MSVIQEADTDNPAPVESDAPISLANTYITLPHTNKVTQVINEAPEVSGGEYDESFDIDDSENTKTKINSDETVEEEEANNKNDFFEDGNKSDNNEDNTPYVRHYTRVRHHPNNLIPNMEGGRVPY